MAEETENGVAHLKCEIGEVTARGDGDREDHWRRRFNRDCALAEMHPRAA